MKRQNRMLQEILIILSVFILPINLEAHTYLDDILLDHVDNIIQPLLTNDFVIDAIVSQNNKHSENTGSKAYQPHNRHVSKYLKNIIIEGAGIYTAILLIDNKGLIVGQSQFISDYWKGEQDKWHHVYSGPSEKIYIQDLKFNASTGQFQRSVRFPITLTNSKQIIGVALIGFNMDRLWLYDTEQIQ